MKRSLKTGLLLLFFATVLSAEENKLKIETLPLDTLKFELPTSITLRIKLARLQEPEFVADGKKSGRNLSASDDFRTREVDWITVYRASDGTVFLVDRSNMGLWLRDEDQWQCLLNGMWIFKTFGGAFPHFPVQYLGKGFFAFPETVPGKVEEKKDGLFPQALAVTFLLDTKKNDIVARSKAYIYDHNPPVKIPNDWKKRYQLPQIESPK